MNGNPPPSQAARFFSDEQKISTYKTGPGFVTAQFAEHNLTLIPPLPQGGIVHDNACGPGVVTRLLMAKGYPQNLTIHATDIDPVFLAATTAEAQTNSWPVEVSNQRSEALNFADNFFDLSIMNFAIFACPNAGLDGAKEIYRTLKPGGTAVVNCWQDVSWLVPSQVAYAHTQPGKEYLFTKLVETWADGTHLQKVMKDAGFKEENMSVHESNGWATFTRQEMRGWVEKGWAFLGGVGGWAENAEQAWDETIDLFIESLLKQPGTEVDGDNIRARGSQWAVIARK